MEKSKIFETAIRELTEAAISKRKENMADSELQLYTEVMALSAQVRDIVKTLPEKQRRILKDYFVKTNLIADHECHHLYVQGPKDCVELLKKARCAVREDVLNGLCESRGCFTYW